MSRRCHFNGFVTHKRNNQFGTIFAEGTLLRDAYSNQEAKVTNGKVTINSNFTFVLLEAKK
jgi:alpha-amylase